MPSPINLRNPARPIHVGVILLKGVTEHLDIAPAGFFSYISRQFLEQIPSNLLSNELKSQSLDFEYHWVTEDGEAPARLTGNMKVLPTNSFANCPPLDILLLGANELDYEASEVEKQFLRKAYANCAALLCVCGGYMPVMAAGILEGKTATAPLFILPKMKQMAPGTNWVEKRWVCDEKVWTTGSLLNGMDMMAAFGRHTWGGEDTLVDYWIPVGHWPERDVDYADAAQHV